MKQRIVLKESDLHRMIKESVRQVVREEYGGYKTARDHINKDKYDDDDRNEKRKDMVWDRTQYRENNIKKCCFYQQGQC